MKIKFTLLTGSIGILTALVGVVALTPIIFADHLLPGTYLATTVLSGVSHNDLQYLTAQYNYSLQEQTVTLQFGGRQTPTTLGELGVSLDTPATIAALRGVKLNDLAQGKNRVPASLSFDDKVMSGYLRRTYGDQITMPQNATLTLSGSQPITLVPGRDGEQINLVALQQELTTRLALSESNPVINLSTITAPADITSDEISAAQQLTEQLLTTGLQLQFNQQTFHLKPYTLRRLITFVAKPDSQQSDNLILKVELDHAGLVNYLQQTIAPVIDQSATNAKFELLTDITPPRAKQFSLPRNGQQLNIPRSVSHINTQLDLGQFKIPLAVDVTTPEVTDTSDIEQLGLTSLLATGESDFVGSPKNRQHNISVGASRYHGLLIPSGTEFSFNEYLGPINAAGGWLPELVIKHNVTTPEYGGGLCQVSTTAFRAALKAGLSITDRRNHAYAVSYYGTPGLDATIYPPSTDLKFINNTPNYILIQTRIDGTKIFFDFWGTYDGRQVAVSDPVTYDRQSNGAVKAYVKQQVTKDNQVIIEDTFYSRYKSPRLFPKVLAANGEKISP